MPVARPHSSGGLVFNEQTQWWERNGSSWQPHKKSQGGHQTSVELRHFGVVSEPRASRLFGKIKTLLGLRKTLQQNFSIGKQELQGVKTVVYELPKPKAAAEETKDLGAKTYVAYAQKQPFKLLKSFRRKNCRHPSTCTLHPHVNVDFPQTIDIPLAEEPEKLEAAQSAFSLRPCQHIGHEHLSHNQDPCFSCARRENIEVQSQEDAVRALIDLAARDTKAKEPEKNWQPEKEQQREQEMPVCLPTTTRKENRLSAVSPQTIFHNAAKRLQDTMKPELRGEESGFSVTNGADIMKIRGGSGRRLHRGQRLTRRMRELFTGVRMDPIAITYNGSDEDNDGRTSRRRQSRHRVLSPRELAQGGHQWETVPVLNEDDVENILGEIEDYRERSETGHNLRRKHGERVNNGHLAHRGALRSRQEERGGPYEVQNVNTLSDEELRRLEPVNILSSSHSRAHSDSSDSINFVRAVDVPRERFGETHGQGQPEDIRSEPAVDDSRTQLEWAQWDARTHRCGANVLTRRPTPPRYSRIEPYTTDYEVGLRAG